MTIVNIEMSTYKLLQSINYAEVKLQVLKSKTNTM